MKKKYTNNIHLNNDIRTIYIVSSLYLKKIPYAYRNVTELILLMDTKWSIFHHNSENFLNFSSNLLIHITIYSCSFLSFLFSIEEYRKWIDEKTREIAKFELEFPSLKYQMQWPILTNLCLIFYFVSLSFSSEWILSHS